MMRWMKRPIFRRRVRSRRVLITAWSGVAAVVLTSAPALAEQVPQLKKGNEGWIGVVIAIVLVVAVGVASFINPKRGHQD